MTLRLAVQVYALGFKDDTFRRESASKVFKFLERVQVKHPGAGIFWAQLWLLVPE
jgi:hypothetical protein